MDQQINALDGFGFNMSYRIQGDREISFKQQRPIQSCNKNWGNAKPVVPESYSSLLDCNSSYVSPQVYYHMIPIGDAAPSSTPYTIHQKPEENSGTELTLETSTLEEVVDEPPLLEELGIIPEEIIQKTKAVLNPMRQVDTSILENTDLTGPLVFVLIFSGCLLLSGKVHFNYIYAVVVVGCLAIKFLVSVMSVSGTSVGVTTSVLGYCLLPLVIPAAVSIFISLKNVGGVTLTGLAILWCSLSASTLFAIDLTMTHQRLLVGYPCALFYAALAMLTIF